LTHCPATIRAAPPTPVQNSGVIQAGRLAAGTLGGMVVPGAGAPPAGIVAPGRRKIVVVVVGAVVVVARRVAVVRGRLLVGTLDDGTVAGGDVVADGSVVWGVVEGTGGWVS